MRFARCVFVGGIVAAIGGAIPVVAAPATEDWKLDAGFGVAGAATLTQTGTQSARALVIQPDGKLLIAGATSINGDAFVTRLNVDGSPDSGFGTGGTRTIDSGGTEVANALALQSDGKILVAGSTTVGGQAAVYRLNANGTSDPTFDHDGALGLGASTSSFNAVAVQPDGKIVLAGSTSTGQDALVYRLGTDGTPDATFGTSGAKTINSGGTEIANAVALQADGKILVAGSTTVGLDVGGGDGALYRLSPNGTPDPSFDGDGALGLMSGGTEAITAIALDGTSHILLAGSTSANLDAVVYRVNTADGTLDTSFHTNGKRALDDGGVETATGIARQADGEIVVSGWSTVVGPVAYRLDPDGARDQGFGTDGEVDFGATQRVAAVALASNGDIVMAGDTQPGVSTDDAIVFRLHGTPIQPPTGTGGAQAVTTSDATTINNNGNTVPSTADVHPPGAPGALRGRFSKGTLTLSWKAATDDVGVTAYRVVRGIVRARDVTRVSAAFTKFSTKSKLVFRVVAVDAADNQGPPSNTVTVTPRRRPTDVPRKLPSWAPALFSFETAPKSKHLKKPRVPSPRPRWYAHYKAWRLAPYSVVGA